MQKLNLSKVFAQLRPGSVNFRSASTSLENEWEKRGKATNNYPKRAQKTWIVFINGLVGGGKKEIGRIGGKEEALLRLTNTYAFSDGSFKGNLV